MVVSVSLVKKLRKQPGKRIANAISGSTRSQCDGKLSGGLGAPRLGTLKAVCMPKVAVRPWRHFLRSVRRGAHSGLSMSRDTLVIPRKTWTSQ